VQVSGGGLLLFAVALRDQEQDLVFRQCRLDRGQRSRPANE
jgi:hypothetical protein